MVEVPGKFDFPITRSRNFGERTVEVCLHRIADCIELQANLFDFVLGSPC
jgi:hypothetical protein